MLGLSRRDDIKRLSSHLSGYDLKAKEDAKLHIHLFYCRYTSWSLGVRENPERGAFVNIRQERHRNQEKPSCSLAQPGVSLSTVS